MTRRRFFALVGAAIAGKKLIAAVEPQIPALSREEFSRLYIQPIVEQMCAETEDWLATTTLSAAEVPPEGFVVPVERPGVSIRYVRDGRTDGLRQDVRGPLLLI